MKKIQFSLCLIFIFFKVNVIAADVPALEFPCKDCKYCKRGIISPLYYQVCCWDGPVYYSPVLYAIHKDGRLLMAGNCPKNNSAHNRALDSLIKQMNNYKYQLYIDFVKISTKMADNLKNASLTYLKTDDALQKLYYENLDIFVANDCLKANAQCIPPDFNLTPSLFEYRPNAFFCAHENRRAKAYHLLHMYSHTQKRNSYKFNHETLFKIDRDFQAALAKLKKKQIPLQKQITDVSIQIRRQCKYCGKGQKLSLNTTPVKISSPANLNIIVNQLPTEKSLNTFNMHVYTDNTQLRSAKKHYKKIYRSKIDYINKEYEKQLSGLAKDTGSLQDRTLNYADSLSRKKSILVENIRIKEKANILLMAEDSSIVPIEFKKSNNHKYAFDNFSSWSHGAADYYGAKRGRCKTPYVLVPEGEKGYLKMNYPGAEPTRYQERF